MLVRNFLPVLSLLFPLISATASPEASEHDVVAGSEHGDLEKRWPEMEILEKRHPEMENLNKRDIPPGYSQVYGPMKKVYSATANLLSTTKRMPRFNNTACAVTCVQTDSCKFFYILTSDSPRAGVYCQFFNVVVQKKDLDSKLFTLPSDGTKITLHGNYGYELVDPTQLGGSASSSTSAPLANAQGVSTNSKRKGKKNGKNELDSTSSTKKASHKHKVRRHGHHA